MKTLSWSAGIALLTLAVCVPSAGAETIKCQRTIAKASSQFVQARLKALSKCEGGIVKSGIAGTCPDAKACASITKASDKLAASIAKSCGGSDKVCNADVTDEDLPATLGWPSTCPNIGHALCNNLITNCAGIATCLTCLGSEATDEAANLYYGFLALPSTSNKPLNKCQTTIGKATSAFLNSQSKVLQKCWDARLNGKHSNSCVPPAVGDGKYLAAIVKAETKKVSAITKACGGADKALGGVGPDADFTPAQIGFPANCPAVTVPSPILACGGAVTDLQGVIDCVDCLSTLEADCVDRAQVPQFASYPPECGDCMAPDPVGPCPTSVEFTADGPNVDLDTGFTGLAHNATVPTNGRLTLTVSGCAGGSQPTCGQCNVGGPVVNAAGGSCNAGGSEFDNQRCQDSPWVQCSNLADCTNAGATGPCIIFFGSPLPLVAGGVSTCVINEVAGAITGTLNLTDGTSSTVVPLSSKVHPTGSPTNPCPTCVNGLCTTGPRTNQPCTTMGTGIHGDVTLDCPPDPGANAGTLSINLTIATGTQTRTVTAANPPCTQTGYTGLNCLCSTCNNGNQEACSSNADCPDPPGPTGAICGGRRCLGGTNAGSPCTTGSECPGGGLCNRPGEPTQPNACIDDTNTGPDGKLCVTTVGNEGECPEGPAALNCSIEKFRTCTDDASCNPITSGGTCAECVATGQTCVANNRPCFTDNGVIGNSVDVTGSAEAPCGDTARPVVGSFFCVAPVAAGAVNAAGGLPALGRVLIPGRVSTLP